MKKKILLILALMMLVFSCTGTSALAKSNKTTALTVSADQIYMKVGQTKTIGVIVEPSNSTSGIKLASSKPSVATVNQSGKIKAKKAGTTVITVKSGSCKKKIQVTVLKKGVKVTKLKFNQKTLTLEKGTVQFLPYTVKKANATTKIKWKSSNSAVVSVTQTGKIKAKKKGTAKITISANGKKAACKIKVVNPTGSSSSSSGSGSSGSGSSGSSSSGSGSSGSSSSGSQSGKKAQGCVAYLTSNNLYIGETASIVVTYAFGDLSYRASKDGIVKIDSKGTITAVGTGSADIYVDAAGDENYKAGSGYAGRVTVSRKDADACGFSVSTWTSSSTYKKNNVNSRQSDGSNVYTINFYCDAEENWIDSNVTFEAEDVTPAAYREMFDAMGVSSASPSLSLGSASVYSGTTVQEPFTEKGPGSYSVKAESGKKLTIKAGAGVRAVKVYAKKGSTVLDYIYLVSNGYDSSGNYVSFDEDLYKKVRTKVEEQLWSSGMTNYQKLSAVAGYINGTTHYPGTPATAKTYNPTFWERWAVDDKELYYYMSNDSLLNAIMKFQGGVTTCTAVYQLADVAEDLGLPYLYDGTNVAEGEGVWVVTGSLSSNPGNPSHYSLKYKYPDETTVFLDAQGLGYSGSTSNASCEAHGCQSKIISLK